MMDGLLDQSRSMQTCSSVDDLQLQLRDLVSSKSSDTRAEHGAFTFELRYSTDFHLTADPDNAADNADSAQSQQAPITRTVSAMETIQNQPSDDPVLQKAVAKHIVDAIGATENSSWIVRSVSRGAQGWTFTYVCKDSLQAWTRANAKKAGRPDIASFSGYGGLDPINLSRPAFDCRGSLTVAFSKSSRGVVVKYEHTPLHKTVTQLVERLAPAIPPPPIRNVATGSQRTPKAKRPPPADGEGGSRKRRKRKGNAPEATMAEGAAGDGQTEAQAQNGQSAQLENQGGLHLTSILNVPPAEAERRRQTAIELLSGRGIDPATLSAEQFNIFANQAPDLQAQSLEMLAKYGAERLRIVHPDDKAQGESANSTPTQPQTAVATPSSAPKATSTPGTAGTPTRKPRNRKKKSDAANQVQIGSGAVVPVEENGSLGTTGSKLKLPARKTRGACQTCKDRKEKCTKEHPSCSVCVDADVECIYLPPKPRRKSEKSAEVVEAGDSDVPAEPAESEEPEEREEAEEVERPAPEPTAVQQSISHTAVIPPDPDNEEFIPDPNILSGPIEQHQAPAAQPGANYYQTHKPDGLTFSRSSNNHDVSSSDNRTPSDLTFPQPQSSSGLTLPTSSNQAQQSPGLSFPETNAPSASPQAKRGSARRSLPSGQKQTPVPPPAIPNHASNWMATTTNQAPKASPKLTQSKRPKSRKSGADGQQEAAALPQAATQTTAPLQAVAKPPASSAVTRSPFQSSVRTQSRQGHRSQTNTPTIGISRPPPEVSQPPMSNTSYSTNTSTTSASIPTYDPYSRYNSSGTDQYADTTADHSSTRVSYQSGSYQTNTPAATSSASYSTAPSYDYNTRSSSAANPLSQALNTSNSYGTSNSPVLNQWPTSQSRATAHTPSRYAESTTTTHGYGTRQSDRTTNQNASYSQPQSQSYTSYSSQQNTGSHQSQQQDWYGFAGANNNQSSYNGNRQSDYGNTSTTNHTGSYNGHRSNMSGYAGHGYSGQGDQSIYDLIGGSGANH
ncbi:hypothetical protein F4778DRAFT_744641 [Xylariomycetidae sp. FL2044]|nr:hypothetical protein F4778DRAFT_744641 [Xylariomycetidae sp. FL2044]